MSQSDSSPTAGALSHLRVLDLSRVLAGPWCTQNLADMGADVIKIEKPGEGDDSRHWGPPFFKNADGETTTEACYFASCNRNKRSVTVDIATPEGQELVRQLALQSDVLVENFKTGGLQRYGLDYDTLKAQNPRLIYCSITGFGQTGPYAPRPGYDALIQAMGGIMSLTGEPNGSPQKAGVPVADLCRKHGLSSPTFYKWKAKFGGLDVSEARRLKALEDENAKLKRMLADAMLDNVALKDLLGKKW